MKAALVLLCLAGAEASMLLNDERQDIKPVKDESLMGVNLIAQGHQTLSQLRAASKDTKIAPLVGAAENGLNLVEYETKKAQRQFEQEAQKVKRTMSQEAVNQQMQKAKDAIDYQVQKAKNAVDYQVNHTIKPIADSGAQLLHTAGVLAHQDKVKQEMNKLEKYTYKDFVTEHKRTWRAGSDEYKVHEAAFKKNYAMIQSHNNGLPQNAWAQGINKFMDYTQADFEKMLGYKGVKEQPSMSSLLEVDDGDDSEVPLQFSWSSRLSGANSFHRDQGACGSCWAVAAAQVVEDHLALHHNETYQLSMQHLVSCTPNPDQCGGTGGCQGATSELAFKYIQENGVAAHAHWPYTSGFSGQNGVCDQKLVQHNRFVKIGSYVVLPENKQAPLLKALYQQGPVVVSVAASNWQMYSFGVFSGCAQDAIINHAVVAEGFGKQISDLDNKEHKYFLIKNSWGDDWGEAGYMKIKRFDSEAEHCGIDRKPQDGTGCKNGPAEVKVCGMCGILYDAAYPVAPSFVDVNQGGVYVKGKAPQAFTRKVKTLRDIEEMPLR